MLKWIKRYKLSAINKRRKAHLKTADFFSKKIDEIFNIMEYLTDEGKRSEQAYADRFSAQYNMHMDVYYRLTEEYNELLHSN